MRNHSTVGLSEGTHQTYAYPSEKSNPGKRADKLIKIHPKGSQNILLRRTATFEPETSVHVRI